jgi:hypothetical protein
MYNIHLAQAGPTSSAMASVCVWNLKNNFLKDFCLLRCNTVQTGERQLHFQRNMSLLSWLKSKSREKLMYLKEQQKEGTSLIKWDRTVMRLRTINLFLCFHLSSTSWRYIGEWRYSSCFNLGTRYYLHARAPYPRQRNLGYRPNRGWMDLGSMPKRKEFLPQSGIKFRSSSPYSSHGIYWAGCSGS